MPIDVLRHINKFNVVVASNGWAHRDIYKVLIEIILFN